MPTDTRKTPSARVESTEVEKAELSNAEWLAQVTEQPIEPLIPIIDCHHHFFEKGFPPAVLEFPAMKNSFGARTWIGRPYLMQELAADLAYNNVTHTVYVTGGAFWDADAEKHLKCVGETRKCQQIADGAAACMLPKICAGIVAHADLTMGQAVGEQLDAHIAAGANLRGVRDNANASGEDGIFNSTQDMRKLSDPKFREGLAEVASRGLSFESYVFHLQLGQYAELAAAFPNVTFVLNHAGSPLGVGSFAPLTWEGPTAIEWRKGIETLAALPNVFAKLGGLTMPVCGMGLGEQDKPPTSDEVAAAVGPYYNAVIDAFGAERCMFESNFPVDKASCSYTVLWNAFKRIAKARGCSDEQMAALFSGTAKRVYRLA